MRVLRERAPVGRWLTGAIVLLCLGCGNEPLGPVDPALTGQWRGPTGVDTWDGLMLQQRGTLVTGTHDLYSANFGGSVTHVRLSGTADLPRVTLYWGEGEYRIVASGLLSPDSMSLVLTDSAAGVSGHGLPQEYRRELPVP